MGRNLPPRLQHARPRSPAVSSLEATGLMMAPCLAPLQGGEVEGNGGLSNTYSCQVVCLHLWSSLPIFPLTVGNTKSQSRQVSEMGFPSPQRAGNLWALLSAPHPDPQQLLPRKGLTAAIYRPGQQQLLGRAG